MNGEPCCLKAVQPVFKDNNKNNIYQTAKTDFPINLHSYSTTIMVDDRMVNDDDPHSLESIKKTMLEHDHLFKQQVKELHRLYGVQRMLMKDLKITKVDPTRVANANKVIKQGQQCVAEAEPAAKTGRQVIFDENYEEEPEIELTLCLGNRKYSHKEMKENYQYQEQKTHCMSVDLMLFPNSNSSQFQVIEQQKRLSDRKEQSPSVEDFPETVLMSDQASKRPVHWLFKI